MKKTLLAAKDISKEFGKDRGAVPVLDHVSVDIYEDDFTIIMGPSGAGNQLCCMSSAEWTVFLPGLWFIRER